MNLYLVGFMGTGKSTVAKVLSEKSHRPLLEMDEEIVRRSGRSIPKIFLEEGEEGFRKRETALLQETAKKDDLIVSCGGGVCLSPENRALLKGSGKVVLLTADPDTIYERIGGNVDRPKVRGKSREEVLSLMEKREPSYEAAADLTIRTDGLIPDEIGDLILKRIN